MNPVATAVDLGRRLPYDGTQLRSHWIHDTFGIAGDALVAFRGPASVRGDDLVDLEDRRRGLFIESRDMLHLILERFGPSLEVAALHQRLLVLLAERLLLEGHGAPVRRSGDDLFLGDGKLSVSVATVSPVSMLVHMGFNLDTAGTPVKTAAIGAAGFEAPGFAGTLLERYVREVDGIREKIVRVRAVP